MITQDHHVTTSKAPATRMPRKRDDLTIHFVDGDALIFDSVTSNTHHFNETALAIWEACEPNQKIDEVVTKIIETFAVNSNEARAHIDRVIKELQNLHLVIDE